MPLEPFLRTTLPFRSLEVLGVEPFTHPHTPPRSGDTLKVQSVLCSLGFVVVYRPAGIPDIGRFYGSRRWYFVVVALAKNLPHRSRENEFTDGRVDVFLQSFLKAP